MDEDNLPEKVGKLLLHLSAVSLLTSCEIVNILDDQSATCRTLRCL